MDDFVVYIHYTLDTNEPFYVGEGRLRRSTTNSGRIIVTALCNDGTLWRRDVINDSTEWEQLKGI